LEGKRTFVLGGSLDACLGWIGEETARYAEKDLCANDTTVCGCVAAAAELDQEAESYHEEAGSEDNEGL
jgi:hypothetical protein